MLSGSTSMCQCSPTLSGTDLKAIAFDIFSDQYKLNNSNYGMRAEMDFQFQLFLMSGGKWTVEPPHYEFHINNTEDGHGTNSNYTYFNYIEDDSSKEKAINAAATKLNGYFVVFPL